MHTLITDKSIGLRITGRSTTPHKSKEIGIIVTLQLHEANSHTYWSIDFDREEFYRYCHLLEKTKTKIELDEQQRTLFMKVFKEDPRDRIDYYEGIYYSDEAILGTREEFQEGHSNEELQGIKKSHLGPWFKIINMDRHKIQFDNKKKASQMVCSSAPCVSVHLSRYAFGKFRSACIRAASKLRKIKDPHSMTCKDCCKR